MLMWDTLRSSEGCTAPPSARVDTVMGAAPTMIPFGRRTVALILPHFVRLVDCFCVRFYCW